MSLTKYHSQALMIFFTVAITVGVAVGLVALINSAPKREVIASKRVTMEVVRVSLESKSNSKVDLKVVGAPTIYRGNRLGCDKNSASNVAVGSKWDIVVEDFRRGDRYGTEVIGTAAICRKSN